MLRTLAILSFGLRSVTAFTCNASESCMNDENMKECQEMQAICGDLMIIMESCPLQFACPSCVCGEACSVGNTTGICDVDQMTCGQFLVAIDCSNVTTTRGATAINAAQQVTGAGLALSILHYLI